MEIIIVLLITALAVACVCWYAAHQRAERAGELHRALSEDLERVASDLLTLSSYEVLALRTAMPQSDRDAAEHAAYGMMSELGELMTHWKAHLYYGVPFDAAYMRKECGDLLWFLVRFLKALGFTLRDVGEANVAKLRLRYPERYNREAALARADEAGRRA